MDTPESRQKLVVAWQTIHLHCTTTLRCYRVSTNNPSGEQLPALRRHFAKPQRPEDGDQSQHDDHDADR
jgi:hypothetical protein